MSSDSPFAAYVWEKPTNSHSFGRVQSVCFLSACNIKWRGSSQIKFITCISALLYNLLCCWKNAQHHATAGLQVYSKRSEMKFISQKRITESITKHYSIIRNFACGSFGVAGTSWTWWVMSEYPELRFLLTLICSYGKKNIKDWSWIWLLALAQTLLFSLPLSQQLWCRG